MEWRVLLPSHGEFKGSREFLFAACFLLVLESHYSMRRKFTNIEHAIIYDMVFRALEVSPQKCPHNASIDAHCNKNISQIIMHVSVDRKLQMSCSCFLFFSWTEQRTLSLMFLWTFQRPELLDELAEYFKSVPNWRTLFFNKSVLRK